MEVVNLNGNSWRSKNLVYTVFTLGDSFHVFVTQLSSNEPLALTTEGVSLLMEKVEGDDML